MNEKKFKILAVDDNIKNIQVVGSILKESNYLVGFAFDGKQALQLLDNSPDYDLVLLDVNMPGLNGYETCKKIRENSALKDIPVIFLTALSDTKDLINGFDAGGQDYITKPFNSQELLVRVQTHLELKYNKEQLKKANILLEQKVAERTEQLLKANEELRKANKELESLDGVKADFLKIISHEINTPLNGIIGFTDILKEELVGHEFYNLLEYLDRSAKRLEKFSQLSLLVTEFRTKKRTISRKMVEILPIFNEVAQIFENELKAKNLCLQTKFDVEYLYTEPSLIELCLERMLKNAIRYSIPETTISVSVLNKNDCVQVTIADEGTGFPTKILENPFRLFNIGVEHLDEDKGISLVLIKLVMDAHGGKIEISNNENGGAKVCLCFPNKIDS